MSAQPPPELPAGTSSARGLAKAIRFGREVMREVRANAAGFRDSREERMLVEHQRAVAQHEAEVRAHRGRISAWKATMVGATGSSALLGVAAVGAAAASSPAEAAALGALTLGGAVVGMRARTRAKVLEEHPPQAAIPPLPPARLPRGSLGAAEADRVAIALLNLYDLGPNVTRLSPGAGQDLWRAISEVEPLLRAQIERLGTLDRMTREMPGSRAADVAAAAAREIQGRLGQGADALEELLVAGVAFLAAPDVTQTVPDALIPAIHSLQAYAYGLSVADSHRLPPV